MSRRMTDAGSSGASMVLLGGLLAVAGCGSERGRPAQGEIPAAGPRQVAVVRDLKAPESVRYDPELDVWFVTNINGSPLAKDNNGSIARLRSDGVMDAPALVQGGRASVELNAPKGMAIVGDTLWVADIDAVRAFDKRTGKPVATVSLAGKAKFLNDVAVGPDGIYVTDTGIGLGPKGDFTHPGPDRIFRIGPDRKASLALESERLQGPNGIAWDSTSRRFVVVPFFGTTLLAWVPGDTALEAIGTGPGQQDGVEAIAGGRFLVTSWADSSLLALESGHTSHLLGGLPSPADIGWDPGRRHVAVPLLLENRVEIWELP